LDILWEKTTNLIKEKVSPQNYETWIRPIRILAVDNNEVHLSAPNKFFRDWLQENYTIVIENALSSTAGMDLHVEFLISQESPKPSEKIKSCEGWSPASGGKPLKTLSAQISLNPNYTFERFVIGQCNQFAHAAAVAVAEQPAKNYNPLFIYGGVGLGKTHLLNAIGLHTLFLHNNIHVLYVSAEEFMNELINCIRYDKMSKFREKYRNIDCLLIDDIQFIAGKDRTQEEFFHTFNTLHDSGRQIVVSSDRFPKDIPNLESRLRSRFEWGLIADIQPPEIETKVAIIEKKAQENNIQITSQVAHYIGNLSESNIREIEGYLIRISAFSSLTGRPIDMDLVKEALKKILKQSEKREITVDDILKTVSTKMGVKLSDIKSQKKNKEIVLARQVAMYMSRKLIGMSFPDIGRKMGGRDHSTVIHACNKIKDVMERDIKLKQFVDDFDGILLNQSN
jgi:chromosomal replication initiator protein